MKVHAFIVQLTKQRKKSLRVPVISCSIALYCEHIFDKYRTAGFED